jgi:hypothetical protein
LSWHASIAVYMPGMAAFQEVKHPIQQRAAPASEAVSGCRVRVVWDA